MATLVKTTISKLAPIIILAALAGLAYLILHNPPQAERAPAPAAPQLSVAVLELERRPYRVLLQSYGTVQPRTRSMLVAQVFGEITSINDSLRTGGFFEQGEVLLNIDRRDYLANVKIAEGSLLDAKQALIQEQARAAQALEDWQRLGNQGQAPALVLRQPQLAAAEARVASAQSTLDKARLELERTRVVAPYAGRVMNKLVDQGQVVNRNSLLAEIYAVDYVEVRLPLRNRDLPFIDLPENYRFETGATPPGPRVTLRSELGDGAGWSGRVVRTEGAIDERARQLHVVAQIDDPFGIHARAGAPLKIGQYVTAEVEGTLLHDALLIPTGAIYQGGYVYIVADGILQRRDIEIAWQNQTEALVASGLEQGELLALTPLGQVTSGVRVTVSKQPPRAARAAAGQPAAQP